MTRLACASSFPARQTAKMPVTQKLKQNFSLALLRVNFLVDNRPCDSTEGLVSNRHR
jgi:hypothetical protein